MTNLDHLRILLVAFMSLEGETKALRAVLDSWFVWRDIYTYLVLELALFKYLPLLNHRVWFNTDCAAHLHLHRAPAGEDPLPLRVHQCQHPQ